MRLLALLIVCIAALAFSAPAMAEATIASGVTIAGTDVGGMTGAQAHDAVEAAFLQPIPFVFKGKHWSVSPATLEATAAIDTAVSVALGASPDAQVILAVTVKRKRIDKYANYLVRVFSRKARDARVVIRKLKPKILPERIGVQVRPLRMGNEITRSLKLNKRAELSLNVLFKKPKILEKDIGATIIIRRGSRKLYLYSKTKFVRKFSIAVGMPGHATPLGRYRVIVKERNPQWDPPSSPWAEGLGPIPPGPGNPLGTRWIGTSAPAIGIHGTPQPWTVGTAASHGCIRMRIPEVEWLFERVKVGTPVFIVAA